MMTTTSAQVPGSPATGSRGEPVVEARDITKRFGATTALDGVQLRVDEGTVHALVGRNGAGKSTLVSILTGLQAPDTGSLTFAGQPSPPLSDRQAWRARVACVYQKSTIIPELSVAENLFINAQAQSGRTINWKQLRHEAEELLAAWQVDVDVRTRAKDLTVEQRQLVEIARSLSKGARFIVLDEPTARLDVVAIERLFGRIRQLQGQGVTFLYISHHLHEIFDLCDAVTVYRDARHIVTAPVSDLPRSELVAAMTGERVSERSVRPDPIRPDSAAVLAVTGLTAGTECLDVSFDVRVGEVVGLAGSAGSGKFAVANCVVGLRRPEAGTIAIAGEVSRRADVPTRLAQGVGFVPQDRHREGFVPGISIAENATMTVPGRLGRYGLLVSARRDKLARAAIERLDIVPRRPEQPVADLSGGNQQKVVMARAVADDPKLLVLMAPTAGVDIKSKHSLMSVATECAESGSGVLVVSDDLDDLRYCHRVVTMFRGRVTGQLGADRQDQEIVAAMEGVDLSS